MIFGIKSWLRVDTLIAGLLVVTFSSCVNPPKPPSAMVDGKQVISLPADHAAHDDFANEWWYYAGVVEDDEGSRYAFHVSFFKHWATREKRYGIPVTWFGNPVQFAQAAITNLTTGERLEKEVVGVRWLGTVGASQDGMRVWTGKWYVMGNNGVHILRVILRKKVIDLQMTPAKPWILHGKRGVMPDSKSIYLSCTRMAVIGRMKSGGKISKLQGEAWADHEVMEHDVARGGVGWDWFAVQWDDGTELVHYQMRHHDGKTLVRSMTACVDRNGKRRTSGRGDSRVVPVAYWVSPESGTRFPIRWKMMVPGEALVCYLDPLFNDGEMYGKYSRVRYWEGLVRVSGVRNGKRVTGRAYVELTGYDMPLRSR